MRLLIVNALLLFPLWGFEYNLYPQKIIEGVYCFFGKLENINKQNAGNMVNTCFVQTNKGFVVIDSGPTYAYASQAYHEMQKIAQLPVKYVINTHDHDDHWLGNSFYKEKGTLLIGPRTYEQNIFKGMHTRMQRVLGKELYGKTTIVELDTIVDNNLTLKLGKKTFELKQLQSVAHTKGDLIVHMPLSKIVFAGDLVFNGRLTSLRDGSLLGSLKALRAIDALDANIIVGGHGYLTDASATKHLKEYLVSMKKEVQDALDNDISMEMVTKKVLMTQYKETKLYDVLHSRNVFDAYQELEMYDEEEE